MERTGISGNYNYYNSFGWRICKNFGCTQTQGVSVMVDAGCGKLKLYEMVCGNPESTDNGGWGDDCTACNWNACV